MKFLADESIDLPVVERLRQDGHAVAYVLELGPGMTDDKEHAAELPRSFAVIGPETLRIRRASETDL